MDTVWKMARLRSLPKTGSAHVKLDLETESAHHAVSVEFPRHQPGISALIGNYSSEGGSFVVKVAKTTDVRRWARTELAMKEPRGIQVLRVLTAKWNSLAPRPAVWPVFERFNDLCQSWLTRPSRDALEGALLTIRGTSQAGVVGLLDELRGSRRELRFAPRLSTAARVSLPANGPKEVFALVQQNVGSGAATSVRVGLPIFSRQRRRSVRAENIELLALLAYAALLAERSGLGLDLAPRLRGGQLFFPNLLRDGRDGPPVYVDYFGLAQRDGNLAESGAFRMLYGHRGLIPVLAQGIYRDLTRGRVR